MITFCNRIDFKVIDIKCRGSYLAFMNSVTRPSIYQFKSSAELLRARWTEKKRANPAFSMRSWAKQLGMPNNTALSLILAGKRKLPKRLIPHITQSLRLDKKEALYVEALCNLENAKNEIEKKYYLDRLQEILPKRQEIPHELDTFFYLQDPLAGILLEMIDLPQFTSDPKWLKNKIRLNKTEAEIKETWQRLLKLGLCRQVDGKWQKTHKNLSNTIDLKDLAVQRYHSEFCQIAALAVAKQELSEREFQSYSFNLAPAKIPVAKKLMREFLVQFMEQVEASAQEDAQNYQINLQLFANTFLEKKHD